MILKTVAEVSSTSSVSNRYHYSPTDIVQGYPILAYPRVSADYLSLGLASGGSAPASSKFELQDSIPVLSVTTGATGTGQFQLICKDFDRILTNSQIDILFYCDNPQNLKHMIQYVANEVSTGFTNYLQCQLNIATANLSIAPGWQMVRIHQQSIADADPQYDYSTLASDSGNMVQLKWLVGGGAFAWTTSAKCIRLKFTPVNAAVPVTIKIAGVWAGNRAYRPPIVFSFDDGYDEHYTEFAPILEKYGLRGSFAPIRSLVGTSGNFMTLAQLKELVARGHDVCGHGATSLATMSSQAEIETELIASRDYILDNGLSTNNSHLCYLYPLGGYAIAAHIDWISNALKTAGIIGARRTTSLSGTTLSKHMGLNTILYQSILAHSWSATNPTPANNLAFAKTKMQANANNGMVSHAIFHMMSTVPTASTDISPADFKEFCAHAADLIEKGQAINMTFSELVREMLAIKNDNTFGVY